MVKHAQHRVSGRFETDRQDVRFTSAYYVCPRCGYEAR
jgi:predicted RNA-binding Zn-ribbon protein involved in translation (DUF1610 family)